MLAFFANSLEQELGKQSAATPVSETSAPKGGIDVDADIARVEAANAANLQRMEQQWHQATPTGGISPFAPVNTYSGAQQNP
jgi:hypothetical protein